MKNYLKHMMAVFAVPLLVGCYDSDSAFSVRREMVDVGQANVGDSVKASLLSATTRKNR